jgi:hypothetical protein
LPTYAFWVDPFSGCIYDLNVLLEFDCFFKAVRVAFEKQSRTRGTNTTFPQLDGFALKELENSVYLWHFLSDRRESDSRVKPSRFRLSIGLVRPPPKTHRWKCVIIHFTDFGLAGLKIQSDQPSQYFTGEGNQEAQSYRCDRVNLELEDISESKKKRVKSARIFISAWKLQV